jgi:hypothetical protein
VTSLCQTLATGQARARDQTAVPVAQARGAGVGLLEVLWPDHALMECVRCPSTACMSKVTYFTEEEAMMRPNSSQARPQPQDYKLLGRLNCL